MECGAALSLGRPFFCEPCEQFLIENHMESQL
jgi:hypothetical protein